MPFFKYTILIFFILSQHALLGATIKEPQFEMPDQVESSAGHIRLEWSSSNSGDIFYELEASHSPDFQTSQRIYQGPDLASFISGLQNGIYYYRVRAVDSSGTETSAWSTSIQLTVKHHSIHLAFTLAGVGTVVFLLTTLVVIRGNYLQNQSNEF